MTPELKVACEIIFQEHKLSPDPINWNKNVFRGRISIGLCEKARQTLLTSEIIVFPKPAKKAFTILNPVATGAGTYIEALEMVKNGVPALAPVMEEAKPAIEFSQVKEKVKPAIEWAPVMEEVKPSIELAPILEEVKPTFVQVQMPKKYSEILLAKHHENGNGKTKHMLVKVTDIVETPVATVNWYLKPIFCFVVWPVCAAAAGGLIAYFISSLNF